MKEKVAKVRGHKVGQWVRFVSKRNTHYGHFKVGDLGVIAGEVEFQEGLFGRTNNRVQRVVGVDRRGHGKWDEIAVGFKCPFVKIKTPKLAVVWSTRCNDPVAHFETLAEAKGFIKKLKARRRHDERPVEVGIYKRI